MDIVRSQVGMSGYGKLSKVYEDTDLRLVLAEVRSFMG